MFELHFCKHFTVCSGISDSLLLHIFKAALVILSLSPSCVSLQRSSEALWSSTQTLLRSTCTQKTQASTVVPATITKQTPACLPLTCKALPPSKQLMVSALTSALMTMMAQ